MNNPRPFFTRPLPVTILITLLVILDQATKLAVDHFLPFQQAVPVVPFVYLFRTYNLGVAFSMLDSLRGYEIVAMRFIIVSVVMWLWLRTSAERRFAQAGYVLVIAGALGNIVDRFAYGHVIDFALFATQSWSFAIFNLADSYITIGACLVVLDELLAARRKTN